jgi:hypothetical protein
MGKLAKLIILSTSWWYKFSPVNRELGLAWIVVHIQKRLMIGLRLTAGEVSRSFMVYSGKVTHKK